MGKRILITDSDNNELYPVTTLDNVYDEKNNVLSDILEGLKNSKARGVNWEDVDGKPTKLSQFVNDKNFVSYTEDLSDAGDNTKKITLNKNGENIYPVTKIENIYNKENIPLSDILNLCQKEYDERLNTEEKTVTGAINNIYNKINSDDIGTLKYTQIFTSRKYNEYKVDTEKLNNNTITLDDNRYGDKTKWAGITDWGDGTKSYSLEHTYETSGEYQITSKLFPKHDTLLDDGKSIVEISNINAYITKPDSLIAKLGNLTEISYPINFQNITTTHKMFDDNPELTSINVTALNTSNVTDMSKMFNDCTKLTNVDVSKFDTSNVTNAHGMFDNCKSIKELTFDNWNTENIVDMGSMFQNCESLISLDLSNFNTLNTTSMSSMFQYCKKLNSLNISSFDTSNVTTMGGMFAGCSKLQSLDVSNFNTSNVEDMSSIFQYCSSLASINLANFDTSKVIKMNNVFYGCTDLTSLDLSNFNLSNVTRIDNMFYNCKNLSSLNLSNWNIANIERMENIFRQCNSLELENINMTGCNDETIEKIENAFCEEKGISIENVFTVNTSKLDSRVFVLSEDRRGDISNWNGITDWGDGTKDSSLTHTYADDNTYTIKTRYSLPSKADCKKGIISVEKINSRMSDLSSLFSDCYNLTSINMSKWNASKATNMQKIFYNCSSLTSLDLSNFDTSNVTDMSYMFSSCTNLTSVDVSKFDTSSVTDMSYMFSNCKNLTSLNVIKWDTSNVTNMRGMFDECEKLTTLNLSSFNTSNVTDMNNMFYSCNSLSSLDVSNWDTSNVTDMSYMFYNCNSLASLDVSSFDTNKVNNIRYMFYGCPFTSLDVSNFDTSNVTEMSSLFNNCNNLNTLDLSDWNINNVTDMNSMFNECTSLTSLDLSNWNTNNVTDMNSILIGANAIKTIKMYNSLSSTVESIITQLPTVSSSLNSTIYVDINLTPAMKTNLSNKYWNYVEEVNPYCNYFVVDTTKTTNDLTVTLVNEDRYIDGLNTDLTTDWGDGTVNEELTHTYSTDDTYTIRTKLFLDTSGTDYENNTRKKVIEVKSLSKAINNLSELCMNCNNMISFDINNKLDTSIVTDMNNMFHNCKSLTSLNVSNWNTSNVTNMRYMFHNCFKLASIDVSNWDTSKVTDISRIFYNCNSLTSIDVSGLDISKVNNTSYMFYNCYRLTSLNVSNWNTSNVTDMSGMFYNCKSLSSLDVSNFDTTKVTDMSFMFNYCIKLSSLDVSNFDTSKVNNMSYMFYSCIKLSSLNLSNFDTSNVTDMDNMFNNVTKINTLKMYNSSSITVESIITKLPTVSSTLNSTIYVDIVLNPSIKDTLTTKGWNWVETLNTDYNYFEVDTSKMSSDNKTFVLQSWRRDDDTPVGLTDWGDGIIDNNLTHTYTENGIYEIKSKLLPSRNLEKVYDANSCNGVIKVKELNKNMRDFTCLFYCLTNLIEVPEYIKLDNVHTVMGMFYKNYYLLTTPSNFGNTSKVTDMGFMFNYLQSITEIDVSNFDTSNVTDMTNMFYDCEKLTSLDLSNFDTSNVTTMKNMFGNCNALTSLDLSNWKLNPSVDTTDMFLNCNNLTLENINMTGCDDTTRQIIESLFKSEHWSKDVDMPVALKKATTAYGDDNNCIYVLGGCTDSGNVQTMYSYDLGSDTWSTRANIPTTNTNIKSTYCDGKLFLLDNKTIYVYDKETDDWPFCPVLRNHSSNNVSDFVSYKNGDDYITLLKLGCGKSATSSSSSTQYNRYCEVRLSINGDLIDGSVTDVIYPTGVKCLNGVIGCVLNNKLYSIERLTNNFYCYDLKQGGIETLATLPVVHSESGQIKAVKDKVYLFNGSNSDIYRYDISTNCWSKVDSNDTTQYYANITSTKDSIYIMGGTTKETDGELQKITNILHVN